MRETGHILLQRTAYNLISKCCLQTSPEERQPSFINICSFEICNKPEKLWRKVSETFSSTPASLWSLHFPVKYKIKLHLFGLALTPWSQQSLPTPHLLWRRLMIMFFLTRVLKELKLVKSYSSKLLYSIVVSVQNGQEKLSQCSMRLWVYPLGPFYYLWPRSRLTDNFLNILFHLYIKFCFFF